MQSESSSTSSEGFSESSSSSVGVIRHDASASDEGAGTSLTYQHTIADNPTRFVIVSAGFEHDAAGETVTGVTYDGVAMTLIDEIEETSVGFTDYISLWYMAEVDLPSAGTYDVVITSSVAPNRNNMSGCTSYWGVDQNDPIEDQSTATTIGVDNITTNVTTLYENSWVISAAQCGQGGTFVQNGAGAVERYDIQETSANSSTQAAGDIDIAIAGVATADWTYSTGSNRQVLVAIALNPDFG